MAGTTAFRFSLLAIVILGIFYQSSSYGVAGHNSRTISSSGASDDQIHRNLLAAARRKSDQQLPNCGELAGKFPCLKNSRCRWCRSEVLDDMCFSKPEAFRLPSQYPSQVLIANRRHPDPTVEETPVRERDLREIEIDDLRRQVQQQQERLQRFKPSEHDDSHHLSSGEEDVKPISSCCAQALDEEDPLPHRPQRYQNYQHDDNIKVEIPEFEGRMHGDDFIDRINTLECFFDYKNVIDDRKVKLVAIILKKHASIWLEHLKKQHTREGKGGHMHVVSLVEKEVNEEVDEESLSNEGDDDDITYEDQGDSLVIRRNLNAIHMKEDNWLRNNIFHTRCTSHGKMCDVIIDGGSCENVVTTKMVEKLHLKTKEHPQPYKLSWLHKGNEI